MTRRRVFIRTRPRHDIRSSLPAAIVAIMQDGLLDRMFQEALLPEFLYPATADNRPWAGNQGDTATFTRTGLLSPKTTPLAVGSDPTPSSYGIEQWSATMDLFGDTIDTNLIQSAATLASKFLEDNEKLAIGAGQSLNQIARNELYKAYAGGRTFCDTADGGSNTSIEVDSVDGFTHVLVNGVPTAVSAGSPLPIKIEGVANTVTGVNTSTKTLTLGTARVDALGDAVVADNAPVSFRPGAKDTARDLLGTDVATFSLFMDAVARLRRQHVPTINGHYVAHIDSATERELFDDADFKTAYQGRGDSPVFQDLSIGRFAGIDWVRNEEAPTVTPNAIEVHRPVVMGAGALVAAPFERLGSLLSELSAEAQAHDIQLIGPANGVQVARIIRAPQDRLAQTVASSWMWLGDFATPSDSVTGDAALFKRAVMIEHA